MDERKIIVRKAELKDIPAVAGIYDAIHDEEEAGKISTGWIRGVYPTEDTARSALAEGCLYVMEELGEIVASARINQRQEDVYSRVSWLYEAGPEEVMVLHTLTVDPDKKCRGYGTAFESFYEDLGRAHGCRVLRIDTNAKNAGARRLYAGLDYREAGIEPCCFNGIGGVDLVCLEKKL